MTITTNPARNEYTSTAGQTVFNYTFKIYVNTDLNVYVTPDGQVADDATDITTDYVVDTNTIGDPAGGFITFNTPLNLNDKVTIVSAIPDDRTTDYQFNGDFQPDTVNNDFDRTVSLVKQLENALNRTVQFQESQQGSSSLSLPAPAPGELLLWNPGGTGFDNSDGTDIGGINQAVTDAQTAAANAQTSETNAGNSATSAQASATTAQTAAAKIPDPGAGDALKVLRVNAAETANEYVDNDALITNYDNSTSGLTATNVKTAIDELAAGGATVVPTTSASRNQAVSGSPVSQNASPDTLDIVGNIFYGEGFGGSGEANVQEDVNTTFVMGAGFESNTYYVYKDKGGAVGATTNEFIEYGRASDVPGSPVGDYYVVELGKAFNSAGTEISRVYLAIVVTDGSGNPTTITNYTINKLKSLEGEFYEKLTVGGELDNKQTPTAWAAVDGAATPPTILDHYNVTGIVDNGAGDYNVTHGALNSNRAPVASASNAETIVNIVDDNNTRVRVRTSAGVQTDAVFYLVILGGK